MIKAEVIQTDFLNLVQWHMTLIKAIQEPEVSDREFKASLGSLKRLCLKMKNKENPEGWGSGSVEECCLACPCPGLSPSTAHAQDVISLLYLGTLLESDRKMVSSKKVATKDLQNKFSQEKIIG